jgi:hypothetical protein
MRKGLARRQIGPKIGGRSTTVAGPVAGGAANANAQLVLNAPAKSAFLALIRLF